MSPSLERCLAGTHGGLVFKEQFLDDGTAEGACGVTEMGKRCVEQSGEAGRAQRMVTLGEASGVGPWHIFVANGAGKGGLGSYGWPVVFGRVCDTKRQRGEGRVVDCFPHVFDCFRHVFHGT